MPLNQIRRLIDVVRLSRLTWSHSALRTPTAFDCPLNELVFVLSLEMKKYIWTMVEEEALVFDVSKHEVEAPFI